MSTGRGGRGRRAAVATALLAALLAAGCTGSGGPADDGREPRPDGTDHPPVLAVKLDNSRAARPHTGVDAADVVYVEQVEGGVSRLMAVYATRLPGSVGPVRSARESDLELLRQFDRPVLAFSGAQRKLLPLIERAPLEAVTPRSSSGAFARGGGRPAPHNLYLRPERLGDAPPGPAALTTGFRFGRPPAGGEPQNAVTVRYPAATFTFTWSEADGRWPVSMDGAPATTATGGRLAPATVVVQYVTVRRSAYRDYLGNNTPYTETVGSGRATVLRDGRAYEAGWSRPSAGEGTSFTTGDGERMTFARGQVWVVYADAG